MIAPDSCDTASATLTRRPTPSLAVMKGMVFGAARASAGASGSTSGDSSACGSRSWDGNGTFSEGF